MASQCLDSILIHPARFLKLNCALYGDSDPNHIFIVTIDANLTVNNLKGRIKDLMNPFYQNAPSIFWQLWKVELPIRRGLREIVQNTLLHEDETLIPLDNLSSIFIQDPKPGVVNIIAKPPSIDAPGDAGHLTKPYRYNIVVANYDEPHINPNNIFTLTCPKGTDLSSLKRSIKETVKPLYDQVPYPELRMWVANLPIDENLAEDLKALVIHESPIKFTNLNKYPSEVLADRNGKVDYRKLHFVVKPSPPSYFT